MLAGRSKLAAPVKGRAGRADSVSDTPDGKCPALLAGALTMEGQSALTEVVEPGARRIIF